MARILGLDLGSHTVKAVLVESQMRGFQTRTLATVKRASTVSRSARPEAPAFASAAPVVLFVSTRFTRRMTGASEARSFRCSTSPQSCSSSRDWMLSTIWPIEDLPPP